VREQVLCGGPSLAPIHQNWHNVHMPWWKCNYSSVLSEVRNKSSKFYTILSVLTKLIVLKNSLVFCGHSVYYDHKHSATVLVAFAFQGPPSGTHSHKTYEAVTFPGNSSSVDLTHGCLSVLMCRWHIWEFFIEDALYKFTFWLIDWICLCCVFQLYLGGFWKG